MEHANPTGRVLFCRGGGARHEPGLTREEDLIGTRRVNSDVHAVRVQCSDLESGERTNVPDATFVGQVNKLPEYDTGVTETRSVCRITSPVLGTPFGPSFSHHTERICEGPGTYV